MYLPLEYVKRYSVLTELYCSEEYINCEPEVLLVYCIVDIWLNVYSYYSRFMLK